MYVCIYTYKYGCLWSPEDGGQKMDSGLPGSVVIDSSEPLNIGVGNWTQGLEKRTKHLYMLSTS